MTRVYRLLPVLLAAAALWPASASTANSYSTLDAAASWLAQRTVSVQCATPEEALADPEFSVWGAAAYVKVREDGSPDDSTVVAPPICDQLLSIGDRSWPDRYTISGLGWAVIALTHESGHMRGWQWWKNEAKVNCWAVRHVRYTALRLGASDDLARAIRSWAAWWWRHQPATYRLPGCQLPAF